MATNSTYSWVPHIKRMSQSHEQWAVAESSLRLRAPSTLPIALHKAHTWVRNPSVPLQFCCLKCGRWAHGGMWFLYRSPDVWLGLRTVILWHTVNASQWWEVIVPCALGPVWYWSSSSVLGNCLTTGLLPQLSGLPHMLGFTDSRVFSYVFSD